MNESIDDNWFPTIQCNSFSLSDFKDFSPPLKSISIFNVNIRSCRRNFTKLESLLTMTKYCFDFITLTET